MLLLLGVTVAAAQMLRAEATLEPPVSDALSTVPLPAHGKVVINAPAGDDNSAQTLNLYGGGMRPLVEERYGVQTLNIYGPGGRIIAQVVQDGQEAETVRYLLTDHLGSTRVVLDAEGNAVARYEYAPHGETTVAGDDGAKVQYRYTGHPYDEEQDVYQTSTRGYEPTLGRFLSVDPQRDDASPYVYAGNNPVGYLDPTGGGKVPYFTKSVNPIIDPNNKVIVSIGELFDKAETQKIMDNSKFRIPPGGKKSHAADAPRKILYGWTGKESDSKYKFNEKFFWIIDNPSDTVPDDFLNGLDRIRGIDEHFANKIVLLDFTGTNTGADIQLELETVKIPAVLVNATIVSGRNDASQTIAKGFVVGRDQKSPPEFKEFVEQRIRDMWPNPVATSSPVALTNLPVTPTSSSKAIAGPSGMAAGQKHSGPPLDGGITPSAQRTNAVPEVAPNPEPPASTGVETRIWRPTAFD